MQFESLRRPFEPLIRTFLHAYWRATRGLTLGVRGLVIDGTGRVFLIKHSYLAGWHLPGGGVEVGETPSNALARELREEGNIERGEAPQFFAVYFNRRVSRRDHVALYVVRSFHQSAPPQPNSENRGAWIFCARRAAAGYGPRDPRAHRRSARRPQRCGTLVKSRPHYRDVMVTASFGPRSAAGRNLHRLKMLVGRQKEDFMRNKLLALTAAVALGTAVASTGAMAAPHGGGHFSAGHVGGAHFAAGRVGGGHYAGGGRGWRGGGWGPGVALGLGLGGLYAYGGGYPGYCGGYPYYYGYGNCPYGYYGGW